MGYKTPRIPREKMKKIFELYSAKDEFGRPLYSQGQIGKMTGSLYGVKKIAKQLPREDKIRSSITPDQVKTILKLSRITVKTGKRLSYKEISKLTKISENIVSETIHEFSGKRKKGNIISEDAEQKICETITSLSKEKKNPPYTYEEISRILRKKGITVSPDTIGKIITKSKIEIEKNKGYRKTPEDKENEITNYAKGILSQGKNISYSELATKFNIPKTTIIEIFRREEIKKTDSKRGALQHALNNEEEIIRAAQENSLRE